MDPADPRHTSHFEPSISAPSTFDPRRVKTKSSSKSERMLVHPDMVRFMATSGRL